MIRQTVMMLGALAALSGCAQEVYNGHKTEDARFTQLRPGMTKDQVLQVVGSPSSKSDFRPETWYYISTKAEQRAFLPADITHQDVVIVEFEDNGTVAHLGRKGPEARREVQISKDETHTEGHSITVVQQLMGNLGRFNPDAGGNGRLGSGGRGGPGR